MNEALSYARGATLVCVQRWALLAATRLHVGAAR